MRIPPCTTCATRLRIAADMTYSGTWTRLARSAGGVDARYTRRRRTSTTQYGSVDDGTSNTSGRLHTNRPVSGGSPRTKRVK